MSAPTTRELAALDAQRTRLRQIDGAPDWHTRLGEAVYDGPLREPDPPRHCYPAEVSIEVSDPVTGVIQITWHAIEPVEARGYDAALRVLADMRAALVDDCPTGSVSLVGASVTPRDDGSNYAVIAITVEQTIILTEDD